MLYKFQLFIVYIVLCEDTMVRKITKKIAAKVTRSAKTKSNIKPKVKTKTIATKRKVVSTKSVKAKPTKIKSSKTKSPRKKMLVKRVSFSPAQWKKVRDVLTTNNCPDLQTWILQSMKLIETAAATSNEKAN